MTYDTHEDIDRGNFGHYVRGMIALGALALLLCSGCTHACYKDSESKLCVTDVHPVGGAVNAAVALDGKGTLVLSRDQESTEGLVEAAASALAPSF